MKGYLSKDFFEGTATDAYRELGAHALDTGYRFAVWAPGASRVSVVGDFNGWDREANPMESDGDGIYRTQIAEAETGQCYKFAVFDEQGACRLKADPYARMAELRPATASVLTSAGEENFEWTDSEWLESQPGPAEARPINIYELHLGSWKRHEDGSRLDYEEIADELIPYVIEMGYTHVEFMPLMEHPLDASWGYQLTGYYAPTRRYGYPLQLKRLINRLHEAGIGVILDWVPAHFPKDEHGLARFTGRPLYEYPNAEDSERRLWGTLVFNYREGGVRSFLISNAFYWIHEYHADGLRYDAVSSMIYKDYDKADYDGRKTGALINHDALSFFRDLNRLLREAFPKILLFAEESSDYRHVTLPVEQGGLGFDFKWDLGWMHDVLDYFGTDYSYRPYQHRRLTFNMLYAFSERFLLPLSHDEFVHGKRAMIEKMPGDYWRKFASYRCLLAHMMTHPGAKLSFMGQEFAQYGEWRFYEGLDWEVADYELHRRFRTFVADLNRLYRDCPVLWRDDRGWSGFRWVEADDAERSVFSYLRMAEGEKPVLVVLNLLPTPVDDFVIGVPDAGHYEILLDTDAACYGGSNYDTGIAAEGFEAVREPYSGLDYRIHFHLPPLAVLLLRRREDFV